jgi:hypothetical protein
MTPEDPATTQSLDSPVTALREPDNLVKLLLAVAVLGLLNLILVALVLMTVRDTHDIVEVEGQRCILVEEEDVAALYCRR